ncbi:uncharacterized protein AB675_9206 [Cyphellophora attinorum]|uniref:Uncharacterized protein n=1 Tax=Cyphellophora attinorum TaxID=1664694 RepID=A0A0N1H667_9EURO|nr:uncharacterized protein AB675_9206 [Phialophora attinorum]KPI41455.1 hypothetical protein AB675_9206 [Phialophora attinorum]
MTCVDKALQVPVAAMGSETAPAAVTLPSTTGTDWQYRILFFKTMGIYPRNAETPDWAMNDGLALELNKHHTLASQTSLIGLKGSLAPVTMFAHLEKYNEKRWYRKCRDW